MAWYHLTDSLRFASGQFRRSRWSRFILLQNEQLGFFQVLCLFLSLRRLLFPLMVLQAFQLIKGVSLELLAGPRHVRHRINFPLVHWPACTFHPCFVVRHYENVSREIVEQHVYSVLNSFFHSIHQYSHIDLQHLFNYPVVKQEHAILHYVSQLARESLIHVS